MYLWWSLCTLNLHACQVRVRSLLLCLCDVFWALFNSLVCWFSTDLSSRVDSVKVENLKLKSENQVLGQYIENLMAASSVFQSATPKAKKKWKFFCWMRCQVKLTLSSYVHLDFAKQFQIIKKQQNDMIGKCSIAYPVASVWWPRCTEADRYGYYMDEVMQWGLERYQGS